MAIAFRLNPRRMLAPRGIRKETHMGTYATWCDEKESPGFSRFIRVACYLHQELQLRHSLMELAEDDPRASIADTEQRLREKAPLLLDRLDGRIAQYRAELIEAVNDPKFLEEAPEVVAEMMPRIEHRQEIY